MMLVTGYKVSAPLAPPSPTRLLFYNMMQIKTSNEFKSDMVHTTRFRCINLSDGELGGASEV